MDVHLKTLPCIQEVPVFKWSDFDNFQSLHFGIGFYRP